MAQDDGFAETASGVNMSYDIEYADDTLSL